MIPAILRNEVDAELIGELEDTKLAGVGDSFCWPSWSWGRSWPSWSSVDPGDPGPWGDPGLLVLRVILSDPGPGLILASWSSG